MANKPSKVKSALRAVKYIGMKPNKPDTVCGTGLFWEKPGDIKVVDPDVAERLSKFPSIWKDVTGEKGIKTEVKSLPKVVTHPSRSSRMDDEDRERKNNAEADLTGKFKGMTAEVAMLVDD